MKFCIGLRGCNPIWVGGGEGGLSSISTARNYTKLRKYQLPICKRRERGGEEGEGKRDRQEKGSGEKESKREGK